MSVQFRYAAFDEYPAISRFLNEYWAPNHVYVRNKELFDWTFGRRSHWDEAGYSFAVAEDGGEIVAILGGIPFSFNCRGELSRGVWIVNYAVRPDHRKGAAALQLLSTFRRPQFRVVIAAGLNPATVAIYKVLRGLVLPEMPRHFGVLPEAVDRATALLCMAHPEWETKRAGAVAHAFALDPARDDTVEHGAALPESWDAIDWPSIGEETTGAARDADYLNWRYLRHPCFEYRVLTVPERERTGLAIWRLETIMNEMAEGREPVDRLARLVEFLPASAENGSRLLHALVSEARAENALGVDFYGYHGPARAILGAAGLRDVSSTPDGGLIPSRFQPLDSHGGGILNAMFVQGHVPCCTADSDCAWYWTKSDSDQDRPN